MASTTVSAETITAALAGNVRDRLSAAVLTDSTGSATWRCQVFLVNSRTDGFMALLPAVQVVEECLYAFTVVPGAEVAVQSQVAIALESNRGKRLGEVPAILADIPWDYLELFKKPRALSVLPLHSFRFETTPGRPVLSSVLAVAAQWVQDMMEPEAAKEYRTAEEGVPALANGAGEEGDVGPVPSVVGLGGADADEMMNATQARIAMLESLVQTQAGRAAEAPREDRGLRSSLFDRSPGPKTLDAGALQRLQRAAGGPPPRLGRNEAVPIPEMEQGALEHDMLGAEAERGVVDLDEEAGALEAELMGATSSNMDPMYKMMLLQMRQTNQLVKALVPRPPQDPIASVLGGSDNASGS